ncbi:MAG TPA: hypothetical protein PK776_15190, partial [Flavobacterium sp.]|nr:hypothetical protein [Flavobacterium sp.]
MERLSKKDCRKNNTNKVFRVVILLLIVSFNTKFFGQEKSENKIVLPIEVKAAFKKRYPDVKASWTREYRGYNNDQLRYEAKFRGSKGN